MRKKIEELKDIHKGKRCFVVGTGPSLKLEQLELLKDEITISTNGIVFAKDVIDFEPTYFCSSEYWIFKDNNFWDKLKYNKSTKVFSNWIKLKAPQFGYKITDEQREFIKNSYNIKYTNEMWREYAIDTSSISLNLKTGTTMLGTGIIDVCLPLAAWLGCDPVYIIGCDCENTGHFYDYKVFDPDHPDTEGGGMLDMKVRDQYPIVYNKFKEEGINLYNLTPIEKSCPGVPKKDFDDII